ncbi:TadE/TadG family type IV pilus assembly protein [Enterovirga sp.]|uniref:TadE/TadG family type IV pilus assembly protein n=1 Tax=Enterovirga sp. TaxID=2026350 RepID=UPI002B628A4B|nr:TadE/TadG family type IV pilus assembly protein [Enterovirga sp.]HMO28076.1 pilus assembly protein [Enterovirga sp.]
MNTSSPRPAGRLRRLLRDARGVAAVEFALVLPVLIAFYLGLNEVQPGLSIKRKLTLATRTLADLTTRSGTLTTSDLKSIFGATVAVMRPYDNAGTTQMVITSIGVAPKTSGSGYTGTVKWSCAWPPNAKPAAGDLQKRSGSYPVPPSFQNDSTSSFILVETQYPYTPNIGYTIMGTIQLQDSLPWPVRDAKEVQSPGVCPT